MDQKEFKLIVLRPVHQLGAKYKLVCDGKMKNLELRNNLECPQAKKPEELSDFEEHYEIILDTGNPNLHDLYTKIQEVCPEFTNKTRFHLYWKYCDSKILPISNYLSYLSMLKVISDRNRVLYLVARQWSESWMRNAVYIYTAVPEDTELVSMIGPHRSVYTAAQEDQLNIVSSAGITEFTTTYSPPRIRLHNSGEIIKKGKEKLVKKEPRKSPKSIKSYKKK